MNEPAQEKELLGIVSEDHRFGGSTGISHLHVFSYAAFEHWVKTCFAGTSIEATCGAFFRPQYMGKMAIAQPICPDCMKYCTIFEKKAVPAQLD